MSTPWQRRPAGTTQYTSSRAYRTLRDQVLVEEPRCRLCSQPSEVVDHIQPFRTHPQLAMVRSNLRALCKPCHYRVTGQSRAAVYSRKRPPERHPGLLS